MGLFDELAEIFSEENNKQMFREVLYRVINLFLKYRIYK